MGKQSINESVASVFVDILRESSKPHFEMLVDKAYVSEYRMINHDTAEVRVHRTPEPLNSETMAARFEDIPEGYELKVKYLGPDSVLGKGWDTYEVQLVEKGSLRENNGHGFLAASMLGLAGIGTMAAIDGNQIANQAAELGIEISPEECGDHQPGGLIKPLYSFKYDGKSSEYGNNIDGLCEYIKHYRRADDVSYTDEGDHYKIHAKYTFTHYVNKCRRTGHTECELDLPKDYFDTAFIINESVEKVFAQILREAYNHGSSKDKITKFVKLGLPYIPIAKARGFTATFDK